MALGLPRQVGFPRRDERKLTVALQHTYALVWVRSTKKSRFARLGQVSEPIRIAHPLRGRRLHT